MTAETKDLLRSLAQYIGKDRRKSADLRVHCRHATGRTLHRSMLRKYLKQTGQPTADFMIPILNWMLWHGVIKKALATNRVFEIVGRVKVPKKNTAPEKKPGKIVAKDGTKRAK